MTQNRIERNGVYYLLDKSPHEFVAPDGNVYKFTSAKKLQMFKDRINNTTLQVKRIEERYKAYKALIYQDNTTQNKLSIIAKIVYNNLTYK